MDVLIVYGLLALVGLAVLRALLPVQPEPPQIIYVVTQPQPEQAGMGCLLPIILGVVLVVVLGLMAG